MITRVSPRLKGRSWGGRGGGGGREGGQFYALYEQVCYVGNNTKRAKVIQ